MDEFEALSVLVELPPNERLASARWLKDRVYSDVRKELAAVGAVADFLYYGSRAPAGVCEEER